MTGAAEPPQLDAAQLAVLKVHATASALAYHDGTVEAAERVDLAASYAVHGDLRLVAADVLEVACLHVTGKAAEGNSTSSVKKIKVGKIEIEKTAQSTAAPPQADAWCGRAAQLRKEVSASRRGGVVRSPLAVMVTGSNPEPVFRVSRPDDQYS